MPTPSDRDRALLDRLAAGLLATAARGRLVADVGPFRALIAPYADAYLMSLAVPMVDAADWPPAIAALEAHFRAHGRIPRLEFFAERHPTLAPALEAAGMVRQMTSPVMVCAPADFRPAGPAGADVRFLEPGDGEAIDAFLALQAEAFAMPPANARAWRPTLVAGLADRSILAAVAVVDGVPAAGATVLSGGDVAELAGVGTGAPFRRRGLASAVCARLVARAFEGGVALCWLSAGDDAVGVYAGLGFRAVGTQINIGRGEPPPADRG